MPSCLGLTLALPRGLRQDGCDVDKPGGIAATVGSYGVRRSNVVCGGAEVLRLMWEELVVTI